MMFYNALRTLSRPIFKYYFRLTIEGEENVPKQGAYIIIANHVSLLDPLLICVIIPRVIHFFTLSLFYYHPLLHWICKRLYCIPIKKDGNDIFALKKALNLLKHGELIGIFPEGTRSWTGHLEKGEAGVGLIALKSGSPLIPVGIRGAYESFPRKAIFPKPSPITITFGKPFKLEENCKIKSQKANVSWQEATDVIMTKIAEVLYP